MNPLHRKSKCLGDDHKQWKKNVLSLVKPINMEQNFRKTTAILAIALLPKFFIRYKTGPEKSAIMADNFPKMT